MLRLGLIEAILPCVVSRGRHVGNVGHVPECSDSSSFVQHRIGSRSSPFPAQDRIGSSLVFQETWFWIAPRIEYEWIVVRGSHVMAIPDSTVRIALAARPDWVASDCAIVPRLPPLCSTIPSCGTAALSRGVRPRRCPSRRMSRVPSLSSFVVLFGLNLSVQAGFLKAGKAKTALGRRERTLFVASSSVCGSRGPRLGRCAVYAEIVLRVSRSEHEVLGTAGPELTDTIRKNRIRVRLFRTAPATGCRSGPWFAQESP